jgi:CheY-like chemotaxis protein
VRIERRVPPDAWTLHADTNQLELALINLAVNARDAMPDGGTLTIGARNEVMSQAAASAFFAEADGPALDPGEYVVITVADTGCGMDEATLARATEPFFTTKGAGKGTGMGLSMVHGFALQSGGALRLSSRPGIGTAAELWLPRAVADDGATSPSPAPVAASPVDQAGGRVFRVLLVDDDPLVRMGTASMLEDLGHIVAAEAGSGAEALAALRGLDAVDLLLTDHAMPGMTGVELARAARALRPGLLVLLASGYADIGTDADLRWPRLPKPYLTEDLVAALAALPVAMP